MSTVYLFDAPLHCVDLDFRDVLMPSAFSKQNSCLFSACLRELSYSVCTSILGKHIVTSRLTRIYHTLNYYNNL